jgi:hypothetical protein
MYQTAARHTRNFLTPKRHPASSVSHLIKDISLNRHSPTDTRVIARRYAPKQSRQGIPASGVCVKQARSACSKLPSSTRSVEPAAVIARRYAPKQSRQGIPASGVCVKQARSACSKLLKPALRRWLKLPSSALRAEPITRQPRTLSYQRFLTTHYSLVPKSARKDDSPAATYRRLPPPPP